MDIVRRKPNPQPQNPRQPLPQSPKTSPVFAPQEDLYITRRDLADAEQAEKKYQRGLKIRKLLKILFCLLFLLLIAGGFFFSWKTYRVSKKINTGARQQTSFAGDVRLALTTLLPNSAHKPLKGEQEGRINILLLGAAGEKKPGHNLTDTIMVMSIDTRNNKLALLSLPRDLYVKIPASDNFTKINSLYQSGLASGEGVAPLKATVTEVTGLAIHYHLIADFDGFQQLIDDLGGINVTVARDIYDTRYPGPNYSYQTFELKKGFQTLDGETALKYVRERHDDPEGDFGRAKRQQQVIQAVKNRVFSVQTMLNVVTLNNMLDTLGENIKTDLGFEELESFVALARKVDTQNINNVVVDAWKKDSVLQVSHVQVGPTRAFILVPRVGSYSEVQELAAGIFDRDALEKRRAKLESENATIAIAFQNGDYQLANKLRLLLDEKLGFKHVSTTQLATTEERSTTVVLDNTGNKKIYTLDELLKKIPAKLGDESLTDDDGKAQADFTILLGSDAKETYKYEEASLEDYNQAQDEQSNLNI